jgi:hypothetical protein
MDQGRPQVNHLLQFLLILVLGVICYANSLQVPLQVDDDPTLHMVAADIISGKRSLQDVLMSPRPVAVLSFVMNLKLHSERVLGFHLFNLAVHLSSALLVLGLLRQIFRAAAATYSISGSDERFGYIARYAPFAASLLFVCHPVQTQAVTYISQRYTSLAAFFYLASLYAYFRAHQASVEEWRGRVLFWWGVALFSTVLAVNCKETAVTLPVMLLLMEVMLFRGKLLKRKLVLLTAGLLLLIIPFQVLVMNRANEGTILQWLYRATSEVPNVSRHDYFLTQLRVIVTYIRLLLFPVGQNIDYDYPLYRSIWEPQVLFAIFVHLVIATTAVLLVVRSRPSLTCGDCVNSAVRRLSAIGIILFYLALSVESSVIPIRDYIFEHRLYLPSVGFFMLLTTVLVSQAASHQRMRKPLGWILAVVCCLLSVATVARNHVWRSEMSLWQDALDKSPGKARPYHSIGKIYYMRWKPEQAIPYLLRSVELDPNNLKYRVTLNLSVGILDRFAGRVDDGHQYQSKFDEVDKRYLVPWLAVSFNNLGLVYEAFTGNLYLARQNYEKSIDYDPHFELAWYNLALVTAWQGDRAGSAHALERLRVLNRDLAEKAIETMAHPDR